jgi:hypothetical protein
MKMVATIAAITLTATAAAAALVIARAAFIHAERIASRLEAFDYA